MSFYVSHFSKKLPRLPQAKPLSVIGYVHDDVSGDQEINSLVEKNEKDKKILDLFKAQLLLPINKRSKALMARFGIDVTKNGQIDAWPTTKAVKFHVNCYMPVDTAVQDTTRLAGTKSKVLGLFNEASTGNTYFYYFPVSMHGVTEDNILKLDRFNTWIYRDTGEPVPDRGDEYNLYHALFDHLNGRNITTSRSYLSSLGMYSEATGVTFTLRNHSILVDSSVRNPGNSALNLIEQQSTSSPAAKVSDDELNIELPPIGEDTVDHKDPFIERLENIDEVGLEEVYKLYDLYDEDITVYSEVPIPKLTDDLEEFLNTGTTSVRPGDAAPDDDDITDHSDFPIPKLTDDQEEFFNAGTATVPPEDTVVEPETPKVEPEAPKVDDGVFSLDDIIKNPKYVNVKPFNQLVPKYKGYKVQVNYSSSGGYSKLKHPQFVIQNIDKDKERIEVVYHETAHHSHRTRDGRPDREDLFDTYNSEFVSSGDAKKALENVGDNAAKKALKARMGPFTRNEYKNFPLEEKLDLIVKAEEKK